MKLAVARRAGREPDVFALFGLGLIGRDVLLQMRRRFDLDLADKPFSWTDPEAAAGELADITAALADQCTRLGGANLHLIWCAGRAGFGAGEGPLALESRLHEAALLAFETLSARADVLSTSVHHVSSAGGLYEGVRLVTRDTRPAPRRAYGEAKLRQERRLAALPDAISYRIYRPSTVYGDHPTSGRVGLITALIGAALNGEEAVIYGRPDTLRDFVFSQDIGRFIGDKLARPLTGRGASILASGKATSVSEVVHRVFLAFSKPIYVRYLPPSDNAEHNTFAPSALDPDWSATEFDTGLRLVERSMRQRFHRNPR
ncbi:hypothetical protein AY599_02155 [Leptolyngbya valderiana BDU 20041]|nr:hypothetical protein AY599_02155 [Leptolyngbya valderiana BDU 20041]